MLLVRYGDFLVFYGYVLFFEVVCINFFWLLYLSLFCNSCLGSLLLFIFFVWISSINCYDKYYFNLLINIKCVRYSVKG